MDGGLLEAVRHLGVVRPSRPAGAATTRPKSPAVGGPRQAARPTASAEAVTWKSRDDSIAAGSNPRQVILAPPAPLRRGFTLQPSRPAMLSAFAVWSAMSSSSQRRPRAMDATRIGPGPKRRGQTLRNGAAWHRNRSPFPQVIRTAGCPSDEIPPGT